MPNVAVVPWKGKHATPAAAEDERVVALSRALASVAGDVDRVSTRALRALADLDGLGKDPYRRLLDKVTAPGWRRDERSFVRVSPFDTHHHLT